jgi:hypothetical protein
MPPKRSRVPRFLAASVLASASGMGLCRNTTAAHVSTCHCCPQRRQPTTMRLIC